MHDLQPLLAQAELVPDGSREAHPPVRDRARLRAGRPQLGVDVVDDGAGDLQRLAPGEEGLVLALGEGPQVEVVDDLDEEPVEVVHQLGVGVRGARDPEAAQDLLTELVRGGDGGGVDIGQGGPQAPATQRPLLLVHVEQQRQQVVAVAGGRGIGEGPLGRHELLAHPGAQLLAGGPPEGHDQHLRQQHHPLGDVAGHQRRDRPRLAGAGARLEQDGAGGQRVGDGEVGQRAHTRSLRSAPPVSTGPQTRSAS